MKNESIYTQKFCRFCGEKVPRIIIRGKPQFYCCNDHRKKWRRFYRQMWWKRKNYKVKNQL